MMRRKPFFILFIAWVILALACLLPVSQGLKGAFPIFTVLWILVPFIAGLIARDTARVGFRPVPVRTLVLTSAINLGVLLLLMLAFEPWSHTYQMLVQAALAGKPPDTTFAWLLRLPRLPALAAMFGYSGLVTLFGEELFFRGWLLQLFKRKLGPVWGIVLQAALFILPNLPVALVLPPLQAILYVTVYTFLGIGLIGGWAASRTDSLWPSLISATACNLALVAMIL